MFNFKEKLEDYTEREFLELLEEIGNDTRKEKNLKGDELENYIINVVNHFIRITEHPAQGDLIFYPEKPEDGEFENIIKIVKEWRRSQGLPLFKDSE
ncbi:bacteriocin immunity protein [Salmonella enterica]|uniref:Bacteriocin immunity protein n=1 Tax=Salmonella enterica subsp. enterica serovar Weslaco TaxID=1243597 RepID=A0A5X3P1E1_SALET|nr:bacteriocin immunity protein [Salmonella enterica]EBP3304694.1 bacteriocin immunity protein [Salmonella enterica subsp. enterica]ECS6014951.1 bacteriocin immunity protein [Salmonella enterica subsp. enterica serovar Rough O:k:1,5]EDX2367707.1 bacteriocin immunity protein [Salmonella enterica subsp. enterica serovar Memphis]EDX3114543.1 bacteriocin immunity protein [Salmonella enterica subsp. enterica serovar Mississippi]EGZ3934307.1 bacteriocin immunity protein [Salmonella enterica subsp. e